MTVAGSPEIYQVRGGEGGPLLVLLHGLGATATVWKPLAEILSRNWKGRWLAPDLRGHGRSVKRGPYDFSQHARDVASLIERETEESVVVLGHSFGGVVAAMTASGDFGVRPRAALAFGVKIKWKPEEVEKALELSRRPAKIFATREEAVDRYLKVSGLYGLVPADSPDASAGIAETGSGWSLAQDPKTFEAVGESVPGVLRRATPSIRLAAGAKDPMVTLDDMRPIDPGAVLWEGAGHNAHVEAPEKVWEFLRGALPPR